MRACLALTTVSLLTLLGCDEIYLVDPAPSVVTVHDWCTDNGRLFVRITVKDIEEDAVDVSLLVGGERLLAGPAGDGLRGLTSDRDAPGRLHRVHWAAAGDLSPADADAVCAQDDFSGATGCVAAPNAPAAVEVLPVTREGGAGTAKPLSAPPMPCLAVDLPGLPDADAPPADAADPDAGQ